MNLEQPVSFSTAFAAINTGSTWSVVFVRGLFMFPTVEHAQREFVGEFVGNLSRVR